MSRNLMSFCLLVTVSLLGIFLVLSTGTAYAEAQKGLIDINTASEKELESIKGIGPAMSKKIVAGRPYKSVEELSKAGIPAKTIESIKPYIKVGTQPSAPAPASKPSTTQSVPTVKDAQTKQQVPASSQKSATPSEPTSKTASKPTTAGKLASGQTVNINTATKEQIESLPGIGPAKAQAIINGRPYAKPEDIMKVKGIKEGTYKKIKDLITVN